MASNDGARRSRGRRGLLFLGLMILGAVGGLVAIAAAVPPASGPASENSSGLDLKPASGRHADPAQPTYQAENPKNNLQFLFSASGLHVAPVAGRVWSVDLAFSGLANQDTFAPAGRGAALDLRKPCRL